MKWLINKLKIRNQKGSWVNFSIVSKEIKEGQKYVLIPEGKHAKLQAENKELQKKLADIIKAGVVVNGFKIIGDLETISKGVSKFDLVPEGEYAGLKLKIKKLQNTLININLANSNEWCDLRKDVEKLTTALNECYSTIAALEKGNEELKKNCQKCVYLEADKEIINEHIKKEQTLELEIKNLKQKYKL